MIENNLQFHPGFRRVFSPGRMTIGFMMPLARLENGVPDMTGQLEIAARADELGFAAIWARDVPFFDPSFGDAGQVYDPWVWLGMLAARTRRITLGTAGIVLPLRHPFHTAKAAFTLDAVSTGRFILGAASGDRRAEFPAFGKDHDTRGKAYREAVEAIRGAAASFPALSGPFGHVTGLDMLPKPAFARLPILAIGSAHLSLIARFEPHHQFLAFLCWPVGTFNSVIQAFKRTMFRAELQIADGFENNCCWFRCKLSVTYAPPVASEKFATEPSWVTAAPLRQAWRRVFFRVYQCAIFRNTQVGNAHQAIPEETALTARHNQTGSGIPCGGSTG